MASYYPLHGNTIANVVNNLVKHTRPISDTEMLTAINFGLRNLTPRLLNASSRLMYAQANFTLPANKQTVDITSVVPPIWRPVAFDDPTNRRTVFQRIYTVNSDGPWLRSPERSYGTGDILYYDIVMGRVQIVSPAVTSGLAGSVTVSSAAGVRPGHLIGIEPRGSISPDGYHGSREHIAGVTGVNGNTISFTPAAGSPVQTTDTVRIYTDRAIYLVNPPTSEMLGVLHYQYMPGYLDSLSEPVDRVFTPFLDIIAYYAAGQLLLATNDQQGAAFLKIAASMESMIPTVVGSALANEVTGGVHTAMPTAD